MGIYDRDYQKETTGKGEYFGTGGLFSNVPPVTRYLLIINILVFVVMFLFGLGRYFYEYLSVYPVNYVNILQVWRLLTYQFLHADILHILFNMMMLYFLGPMLESAWGSRTYLRFYLISGAAGGVVYTLLVLARVLGAGTMVGASGAIYGLMAAAAILYPRMQVYIFGTIPMSMKTLLIITIIFSVMNIMGGKNAGGEAAHLSGVAAGAVFVYVLPRFTNWRLERSKGAWQRKLEKERAFQGEVDRILEKVHQQGLGSLSRTEKNTLKEATRREQEAARR
ncbi:MAG: rhomboid family intramembrane serine protease [Sedimentisphaerales bacterium]|nr:rhomboid family intramembrane serine protease [Sedimentisphaerales bacterium]